MSFPAEEELHTFGHVLKSALSHSMAERHMWLSVFNRPDHSRFTRVQRLTCCLTLVYLYMFLNAMWYGFIKDQSEARDSVSWRLIGWEEILIALVSVLCIFPVAMLLVCIFKRSRSKVIHVYYTFLSFCYKEFIFFFFSFFFRSHVCSVTS